MADTLRARETVLSELAAFPDEFNRLVLAQHDLNQLLEPASDGGWGIVEIVPHLRDWEEIYLERMRKIVDEVRPHLPAHDDVLWAIERDYRGQDPYEVFERFRTMRAGLVAFLTDLPPDAWNRTGEHSVFDEITLLWLANHLRNHDQEHLQQALDAMT
jgi:hypothetical protein